MTSSPLWDPILFPRNDLNVFHDWHLNFNPLGLPDFFPCGDLRAEIKNWMSHTPNEINEVVKTYRNLFPSFLFEGHPDRFPNFLPIRHFYFFPRGHFYFNPLRLPNFFPCRDLIMRKINLLTHLLSIYKILKTYGDVLPHRNLSRHPNRLPDLFNVRFPGKKIKSEFLFDF